MTKEEKLIVSAYTGILMTDFSSLHGFIEEKLGRPIWTHQLAEKSVWDEIKGAVSKDFMELCKEEND